MQRQDREKLKKTLLDMLDKDTEFRHAVAGLIGYKEILDRITSLEDRVVRLEERIVALEEKVVALEERITTLEERIVALEERIVKLEERTATIEEEIRNLRRDMLEGFRRHDEEFARVWKSIEDMRRDMLEGFRRHDILLQELSISIGSLGRRVGRDMERLILNIYRDQLVQLGIDEDKARRFEYTDEAGLYGLKGKRYEFDIVISNDHADIIEVKSRMSEEDIVVFYEKVNSIRPAIGYSVRRLVAVAVHMDAEALDKAKELGIECIYGHIIRD